MTALPRFLPTPILPPHRETTLRSIRQYVSEARLVTPEDCARAVGLSIDTTRRVLADLANQGEIMRVRRGLYVPDLTARAACGTVGT